MACNAEDRVAIGLSGVFARLEGTAHADGIRCRRK
jgi:hypothetical protein